MPAFYQDRMLLNEAGEDAHSHFMRETAEEVRGNDVFVGIVRKSYEKKKKNSARQNLSYGTPAQHTNFFFEKKGAAKPVRTSSMCS